MHSEILEVHAIIIGLVQGVGFRATARSLAHRMGMKGTARNLPDGNVEVYAQGTKQQIDKLFQGIKQEIGPENIEDIKIEYIPLRNYDGFHIVH